MSDEEKNTLFFFVEKQPIYTCLKRELEEEEKRKRNKPV